jgi:DNA-binding winged helix-turn-helix (wHTH) protein
LKLRFDDFTLDDDTRQLLRPDREVHLSPKAFDLLAMLLAARPRALPKAVLHTGLWPDTFVSEANLAMLVAEIRSALGDDARTPRFVRTVQRYGYAFHGTRFTAPRRNWRNRMCLNTNRVSGAGCSRRSAKYCS